MSERINRQWLLARRPVGMVSPSDFEFKQEAVPELAEGQYLVRNLYMTWPLGVAGLTGMTAYFGLLRPARSRQARAR